MQLLSELPDDNLDLEEKVHTFHVEGPISFGEVEDCVTRHLLGEGRCAFLRSGEFAQLRRLALYAIGHHKGAVASAASGLCVRLMPDNTVRVAW